MRMISKEMGEVSYRQKGSLCTKVRISEEWGVFSVWMKDHVLKLRLQAMKSGQAGASMCGILQA